MTHARSNAGRLWFAAVLLAAVCRQGTAAPPAGPVAERDGVRYQVTGPFAHENLTVFLLHGPARDGRTFLTLDEGLKQKVVEVTESPREQVSQLQIENRSDAPLFLQEGDRLSGGKQDRTIYASLVIPPHSGRMPLPAFCIEHGRWSEGSRGTNFAGTANAALAPKAVRAAAKINRDQGAVWDSVGMQKKAAEAVGGRNTNDSLNETFDSPKVLAISEAFVKALGKALPDDGTAVGVAIAVNGELEELNIYPNHGLLKKLYPRLIRSYALQATLEKAKAKKAKAVSAEDVAKFLAGKEKSKREEAINKDNYLCVKSLDGGKACAETSFQGKPVHVQVLSKVDPIKRVPTEQGRNRGNNDVAPNVAPNASPARQLPAKSAPDGRR